MRYQNIQLFQKHFTASSQQKLCRCYLVLIPDDYERHQVMRELCSHVATKETLLSSLSGSSTSFGQIAEIFTNPSLFGGQPVLLLAEVEKLGKKELQSLAEFVESLHYGYLLCCGSSRAVCAASFEKAGVVLDLTEEKPWDKEKRLIAQMSAKVLACGKRLASDAPALLIERLGLDAAVLDQEIEKLVCYVGDRATIERSDIFRIASSCRTHGFWQTAEEIVWERSCTSLDSSSFYGLIPSLRLQMQIGLKISELLASGCPREQWNAFLPKIGPKVLEKRSVQASRLGISYFKKGLDLLFTVELLSRTGVTHELALLDFFRISL